MPQDRRSSGKSREEGHQIFLDLKLHDIPNTVKKSDGGAVAVGCGYVQSPCGRHRLHDGGGARGPDASGWHAPFTHCRDAAYLDERERACARTCLSTRRLTGSSCTTRKTRSAPGLDGVVCSPLEAGKVHEACGSDFLTVTPGVRFAGGDAGDQSRITTPAGAKALGSDYIVVGRPITAAPDPVAAYRKCVEEFVG